MSANVEYKRVTGYRMSHLCSNMFKLSTNIFVAHQLLHTMNSPAIGYEIYHERNPRPRNDSVLKRLRERIGNRQ
eukprot:NODE_6528_length_504_cov_57.329670_g5747_i0.p1 GENE.NODE_6528_length_504_cov_57.329670_g5747_i0~~NODE_6528_length_504_cov_57.329670_g5747_i0.p1  ORF type:complete len:74 (+),score=12.88 NODE_6528_length_504_cov_57.329670_g5747_i0:37-258(+)